MVSKKTCFFGAGVVAATVGIIGSISFFLVNTDDNQVLTGLALALLVGCGAPGLAAVAGATAVDLCRSEASEESSRPASAGNAQVELGTLNITIFHTP